MVFRKEDEWRSISTNQQKSLEDSEIILTH